LAADWYWINSLQYIGRKVVQLDGFQNLNLKDLSSLNPKMLYPLLDRTTTLDPGYRVAYTYGAVVLPAIDVDQAIKLTEKGIAENPGDWVLYQHLGYIYWQQQNYEKASQVYAAGANIPDAPPFLKQMSAKIKLEGGSRETAREIYQHIYDTAGDTETRDLVGGRLLQIVSLNERDAIKKIMEDFREKNGRCIASWTEITSALRQVKIPGGRGLKFDPASSAPVDPAGFPYRLSASGDKCEAELDLHSKIPPS
jgi:tetratricopeptide (TPR) repeat protein